MKLQHRLRSIIRRFQKPRRRRKTPTETIQLCVQRLEPRQVLSAAGGQAMVFSTGAAVALPGDLQAQPADIVQYDGSEFSLLFDGSDVGLNKATDNIDALAMIGDNQILMSFYNEVTIDGLGTVGVGDIVLFQADSLGENTAGTFSLFASANDLGLSSTDNIDALDQLDDGSLVISLLRNSTITSGPGGESFSVNDEDLVQITPDAEGNFSTGTRELFFDGTDAGLDFSTENLDGLSVEGMQLRFSTFGGNSIPSQRISGDGEDVLTYSATQLGEDTQGSYIGITFDGSRIVGFGFNLNALDYVNLSKPSNPPTAQDLNVEVAEDLSLQIQLEGDDGDPDVEQTLTYQIVNGPTHGGLSGFDPATGTFTYTPTANYHGEDQLTYLVQDVDDNGVVLSSNLAVVQITVTSVNDAPFLILPQDPLTGKEDVPLVISGIQVGDVEAESQQQPVVVTLQAEHGIVTFDGSQTAVQIAGNGTSQVTLTGSIAEINSLLAQGLQFQPDTNFSGQAAVEVTIFDALDPASSLSASGRVEVDILSTQEQATAFRDQVFELLESGELGGGSARRLLNAVKLNGHGRAIERTINNIERWEANGRLDSSVAQQLIEQLTDLREGAHTGRFEILDAVFTRIGKAKFPPGLARLSSRR